jgi:hypothetical protein
MYDVLSIVGASSGKSDPAAPAGVRAVARANSGLVFQSFGLGQ